MSPDSVPKFLEETWQWKRESQEATRGMTTEEVIEYYRRAAREFERRTGVRLPKAEEPVERGPAQRAPTD